MHPTDQPSSKRTRDLFYKKFTVVDDDLFVIFFPVKCIFFCRSFETTNKWSEIIYLLCWRRRLRLYLLIFVCLLLFFWYAGQRRILVDRFFFTGKQTDTDTLGIRLSYFKLNKLKRGGRKKIVNLKWWIVNNFKLFRSLSPLFSFFVGFICAVVVSNYHFWSLTTHKSIPKIHNLWFRYNGIVHWSLP